MARRLRRLEQRRGCTRPETCLIRQFYPWLGPNAMKSGSKTQPKCQKLPSSSTRACPPQVLGVEALELQAAVRTDDQPQIWRRAGQADYFHSECLLAGRTTGKRISALHTGFSLRACRKINATTGKEQMQTNGDFPLHSLYIFARKWKIGGGGHLAFFTPGGGMGCKGREFNKMTGTPHAGATPHVFLLAAQGYMRLNGADRQECLCHRCHSRPRGGRPPSPGNWRVRQRRRGQSDSG